MNFTCPNKIIFVSRRASVGIEKLNLHMTTNLLIEFYFKNITIQENSRCSFYKAKRKNRTRIIYKTEVAIWGRKMKCSDKENWI